jgi:hypothetical protein
MKPKPLVTLKNFTLPVFINGVGLMVNVSNVGFIPFEPPKMPKIIVECLR